MKYATPLLGLAILMASVVAAAAEPQIPQQYHGEWCTISHNEQKSVFKRCRDRYNNETGGLQIRTHHYDALETRHTPTKVIPYRNGHKIDGTWVHETGEKGTSEGPEYWSLSQDGRYLIIVDKP
jgi:hypothetical protein